MTHPLRVAGSQKTSVRAAREVPRSEVARQPILAYQPEEFPAYQALLGKLFSPYTPALKIVAEDDNLTPLDHSSKNKKANHRAAFRVLVTGCKSRTRGTN
jgi:hypothetical protein